jgi:OTU domain-containing protein 3
MAKGNTGKGKAQRRDELERKRDERSRKKALKKERDIKEYLENDENFVSFKNQLEAIGLKIKDILGDG